MRVALWIAVGAIVAAGLVGLLAPKIAADLNYRGPQPHPKVDGPAR